MSYFDSNQLIQKYFNSYMLSERALSKVSQTKRRQVLSRHTQLAIPSQEQAQQREQKLKYFHIRSLHLRRKSLENMCKENYRIYFNLNGQESSYKQLFSDRHSRKIKIKQRLIQFKPKKFSHIQHGTYLNNELTKLATVKDIIDNSRQNSGTPASRKLGIRQILTERAKNSAFTYNRCSQNPNYCK